jgi:hypothetical protein
MSLDNRRFPLLQSPLDYTTRDGNGHLDLTEIEESLDEKPQFKHYSETSNIQLFFDLFFVANLTSFTDEHEVNDRSSWPSTSKPPRYVY